MMYLHLLFIKTIKHFDIVEYILKDNQHNYTLHSKANLGIRALQIKYSTFQITIVVIEFSFYFSYHGNFINQSKLFCQTLANQMNRNLSLSTFEETKTQRLKVVVGDYEIDKENVLGYGSFSKVYVGKNKDGQQICVKAMNKFDKKRQHLKIAKQQANILKGLNHEGICKLFATFQNEEYFYLMMQLYHGQNLRQYMHWNKRLSYQSTQTIITQLLDALEYLHQEKIMHRDLKPDNILLVSKNGKVKQKSGSSFTSGSLATQQFKMSSVKLIDFGFSTNLPSGQSTILKQSLGTPSYMAPQLLQGKKYSSKADIWSFGVIIYEMIYGKLPWYGRSQKQLLQRIKGQKLKLQSNNQYQINELLRQILVGCLQIDAQKRIQWRQLFILNDNLKNGNIFLDFQKQQLQNCECSVFSFKLF